MIESLKSFIFLFDLIGKNPQLLIFNNYRYKAILSSLISVIIILISIAFSIYALLEYLKFKNPNIAYSKDNDGETNRNIFKRDFILMFQLIDTTTLITLDNSVGYYVAEYIITYNNGTRSYTPLDIETCEIGKNIDKKYQNFVNDNSNYGKKVNEFKCISSKFENISLFYDPKIGFSVIRLYIIYKNNTIYTPEKIQSLLLTENNIINHFNRKDPINRGYMFQLTSAYSSLEYTQINYNFQYLKYESDEGFIFQDSRILYGMTFSDITSYRNLQNKIDLTTNFEEVKDSMIGAIEFEINKSNFDNYKRNYQKLQSLLAEIMSVINLFFQVGRQIINIFGGKKISLSIIEYLVNKDTLHTKKNENKKVFIKDKNNESSIRKIKSEIFDNSNNRDNSTKNKKIKLIGNNNKILKINTINNKSEKNKILKKINFLHILKSFLCFKDKKSQFVNFCYNIVSQDMSIERILERFYNLEKIKHYLSSEEKRKLKCIKNKKFLEIDKMIDEMNDEIIKRREIRK